MNANELEQFLESLGFELINRGYNFMSCCPNHKERRPSWGISKVVPHLHGCFACFPYSSPVLTSKGFIPIGKVKVGDLVVSDNGSYQKVLCTMNNGVKDVYSVITRIGSLDFNCTKDHGIYCIRPSKNYGGHLKRFSGVQKIKVENLKRDDFIRLVFPKGSYKSISTEHIKLAYYDFRSVDIPRNILLNENLAEWLGWYCAEGSTTSNKRNVVFTLGISEMRVARRLEFLTKVIFGLSAQLYPNFEYGRIDVVISNIILGKLVSQLCGIGADGKKVPNYIFVSPESVRMRFLKAYSFGDGCRSGNAMSFVTVSKELAKGVSLLVLGMRFMLNVYEQRPYVDSKGVNHKRCWKGLFRKANIRKASRCVRIVDGEVYVRVKLVRFFSKQKVYNLTVENTHRYNVNCALVSNCNYSGTLRTLLLDKFGWSLEKIRERLGEDIKEGGELSWREGSLPVKFSVPEPIDPRNLWAFKMTPKGFNYLAKREIYRKTIKSAGLLFDEKQKRIVFPWFWKKKLIGATGRTIVRSEETAGRKIIAYWGLKKGKLFYVPTGFLKRGQPVILVEGEIDALKIFQSGFQNVAALGHGRFSDEVKSLLVNLPVKNLVLFFDYDKKGRELTEEVSKKMQGYCKVWAVNYKNFFKDSRRKLDPGCLGDRQIGNLILSAYRSISWPEF
jgi:5S rRNA maturation endonuclease (ribonuclease M5)